MSILNSTFRLSVGMLEKIYKLWYSAANHPEWTHVQCTHTVGCHRNTRQSLANCPTARIYDSTSLLVKPILFDQHISIYHRLRSMRWITACKGMLVPPTTTRS